MSTEHYFSATPQVPANWREITVSLAGSERTLTTASGLFSPDALDRATAVLLDHVPPPPQQGNLLDIGCGWGPIALTLALRAADADVWAVDVNERALQATATNADRLGLSRVHPAHPDDVPAELCFDAIWANPPIRIGKAALHELLERWLPRLRPGASAWLVVGKQLGADSLQKWMAERLGTHFSVERAATAKGFRVIHVRHHTNPAEELSNSHNYR